MIELFGTTFAFFVSCTCAFSLDALAFCPVLYLNAAYDQVLFGKVDVEAKCPVSDGGEMLNVLRVVYATAADSLLISVTSVVTTKRCKQDKDR